MSTENKPVLTPKLIDSIIRETASDKALSKEAINTKAGITPPGSRENKLLKPWIEANTSLVFGEKIDPQSVQLRSLRDAIIKPDFVGTDSQRRPVIAEIKFKFEFQVDKNYLRRDREDRSIGQILQYACAYMRDCSETPMPRLFIVSIDFSEDVECVCKFLRSKGICIKHIAIENILCK